VDERGSRILEGGTTQPQNNGGAIQGTDGKSRRRNEKGQTNSKRGHSPWKKLAGSLRSGGKSL